MKLLQLSLVFLFSSVAAQNEKGASPAKGSSSKPATQAAFSWNAPIPEAQFAKAGFPSGFSHRTFRSPSMGLEVGYYLYLPPGYEKSGERTYPVVFHLHGGRPGGEAKSVKLVQYVHAAVTAGKIQPTIYVFPNGGPVSWYNYPGLENGRGEDVFVKELIPHLRETLRTRELAIEGFSQGGRGTTRIMMRYPELFTSAAPGGSGYGNEKKVRENAASKARRSSLRKVTTPGISRRSTQNGPTKKGSRFSSGTARSVSTTSSTFSIRSI
jgi:enterochelin esterase-like enzyme